MRVEVDVRPHIYIYIIIYVSEISIEHEQGRISPPLAARYALDTNITELARLLIILIMCMADHVINLDMSS